MMVPFPAVPCLPYAALRPVVRSGDLLLCSGSATFSLLIQGATDSPWSHVGLCLRLDELDRLMVLESVESIGVRTAPLSSYAQDYNGSGQGYPGRLFLARHAAFLAEPPPNLVILARTGVDLLTYPYDTHEILRIAARIVAAKVGLPPQAQVRDRTFICSEMVDECYRAVGIMVASQTVGFIAPCDFALCPDVTFVAEIATT